MNLNTFSGQETIFEGERVRAMRESAKVCVVFCRECAVNAEFVLLDEASAFFCMPTHVFLRHVSVNRCHFRRTSGGIVRVCVNSLLAVDKPKCKQPDGVYV